MGIKMIKITPRMGMWIAAVFVGLASGSNYVYSGYAPQLASELHITSTETNLIGMGGNLGVYLTGPFFGIMVDRRGPRLPLLIAATLSFVGYTGVRLFFLGVLPIRTSPDSPASRPLIFLLALCMFFTGAAGSAGLSSSMNAVAKSFPDRTRASATGAVLAGFGLSAFVFSTLGHLIYHGKAGGLLLLLAIGTALPPLIGSFVIRPYPVHEESDIEDESDEEEDENALARQFSLGVDPGSNEMARCEDRHHRELENESPNNPLLTPRKRNRRDSLASLPPRAIHTSRSELFASTDFYLLFTILALLCGVGLEWINNVGAVTLALARTGLEYDRVKVAALQASQVATISVFNCAGRVLAGAVSDFVKIRFGIKRIWFLPLVAIGFTGSQLAVLSTSNVHHLWLVSGSLGLVYGSLFNVIPMLVLEWFGMSHFSANYGWITLAPVLGGNAFNLLFGRVYDSNTERGVGAPDTPHNASIGAAVSGATLIQGRHVTSVAAALARGLSVSPLAARAGVPEESASFERQNECLLGADCYATAFRISAIACLVALGLSVFAGLRRERKSAERRRLV